MVSAESLRDCFNWDQKPPCLKFLNCVEFLLAFCFASFLLWTGDIYLNDPCETPLAEWAIAMGSMLLLMFIFLFLLATVAMSEMSSASTLMLVLGLLWALTIIGNFVLFVIGHGLVFATDDTHCPRTLWLTCEWCLIITYIYLILNCVMEGTRRYIVKEN